MGERIALAALRRAGSRRADRPRGCAVWADRREIRRSGEPSMSVATVTSDAKGSRRLRSRVASAPARIVRSSALRRGATPIEVRRRAVSGASLRRHRLASSAMPIRGLWSDSGATSRPDRAMPDHAWLQFADDSAPVGQLQPRFMAASRRRANPSHRQRRAEPSEDRSCPPSPWSTTTATSSPPCRSRSKPRATASRPTPTAPRRSTACSQSPPDLAIFDIKMPRMDGMELLRRLRQKSDLPVIFLTSKDEEIDELFGLKMGADDFIRKPFSQRLLVERVKAVLRRFAPKDAGGAARRPTPRRWSAASCKMDPERHTCTWKGEPVTLTVTEFLILQALAQRPGVVKSRNALMDAAYDDQVYVDDRTIDSHIKRLRKKFKVGRRRLRDDRDALRRRLSLQGSLSRPARRCPTGRRRTRRSAAIARRRAPRRRGAARRAAAGIAARRGCARSARARAAARLLEPDAPHRRAQPRRPRRAARSASSTSTSSAQGLIEARVQSLLTQGEIIAGAIAASATVETDTITIDPDKLLQHAGRRELGARRRCLSPLEFSINPERVAPLLRRLVTPTRTRARIYDRDGVAAARFAHALLARRHPALRPAAAAQAEDADASSSGPGTRIRSLLPAATGLPLSRRSARPTASACPRSRSALDGAPRQRRARQRARRDHRLGGGAGPALPRRCAARCCCRRRAATSTTIIASERFALLQVFLVAALRHDRAVAAARRHHRRADAPPRRGRRARAPRHQVARRRSPTSPTAPTRSAICPARCAT